MLKRFIFVLLFFLTPTQGFSSPSQIEPEEEQRDDGRIEAYKRPDHIKHPGRWRYFPPERIVPGDVIDRLLISSFITPIFFRDSDVGTGGGIALTDIDFREKRRQEFAGIFLSYTSEGQQNYSFVWRRWLHHIDLPNNGVLQEERSHLTVRGGYTKALTKRFFGFGPDTREEDESSYTDEVFFLGASLRQALPGPADNFIVSTGVNLEAHTLSDGEVSTAPSTADAYSDVFIDAQSRDLAWVNLGFSYDTRDSQTNPYQGWAVGLGSQNLVLQNDGGYGGRHGAFGTFIVPLPPLFYSDTAEIEENPPTDTLAFISEVGTSSGDLPFFARPSLGGSNRQRGYITNRWTGDSTWFSALEHRFWFMPRGFGVTKTIRIERVGLATFYEVGSVADSLSDLTDASVVSSYGVGLRFTLERSAPFRLDLGFSDEDTQVSARFGLSF